MSSWRRAGVDTTDNDGDGTATAADAPAVAKVRITDARRRVLDRLAAAEPRTTAELAREAGVSAAVIRGMADVGLLVAVPIPAQSRFVVDPSHPGPPAVAGSGNRRRDVAPGRHGPDVFGHVA